MKIRHVARDIMIVLSLLVSVGAVVAVVGLRLGFAPVLSQSMQPSFSAGDVVVTRSVATAGLAPGDVAVLPIPDGTGDRYVHRVVSAAAAGVTKVVTRGDRNTAADPWALSVTSETVPVVVAVIPKIGFLQPFFRNPTVRLAFGIVVMLMALLGLGRAVTGRRSTSLPAPASSSLLARETAQV